MLRSLVGSEMCIRDRSYHFAKDLDISYLHVFTYSERANTVAPNLEDPVPMEIRRSRNKMLRILSQKKLNAFYQTQLNSEWRLLLEYDNKGNATGFTDNYVKVVLTDSDLLEKNHFLNVRLREINEEGKMIGEVIV